MAEVVNTDYYRYSWSVVHEREASQKERWGFVLAIGVMMGMVVAGVGWINRSLGLATREFFWLMVVFGVLVTAVLGYMIHYLMVRARIKFNRYEIGREGVVLAGDRFRFDELDAGKVLAAVEQFNPDKTNEETAKLIITLRKGMRVMELPKGKLREKVIAGLKHYLKEG